MKSLFATCFASIFVLTSPPGYSITPVSDSPAAQTPAPPVSPLPPPPIATPSNIGANVSPAVAQVIKLFQARVSEEVLTAYITNFPVFFNLTPENIIYLDSTGMAPQHVAAMLQHDRMLRDQLASQQAGNNYQPDQATQPYPSVSQPNNSTNPQDQTSQQEMDTNYFSPSGDDNQASYDDSAEAAGYFYPSLAPYGSWFFVSGFGLCWQPSQACKDRNWTPYCDNGQWFSTDSGWFWNSFYPWGWATFHYGRWWHSSNCGWIWCPGKTWGSSWVTWRNSGNCIGWAPLPPGCTFDQNSGLCFKNQPVQSGSSFGLSANDFTFVSKQNFSSWNFKRCRLNPVQCDQAFANTRPVNNFCAGQNGSACNLGLNVNLIAAGSHNPIIHARLQDSTSPKDTGFFPSQSSQSAKVSVFRPQVDFQSPTGRLDTPQPSTRQSLSLNPQPPFGAGNTRLDTPQPSTRQSLSLNPQPPFGAGNTRLNNQQPSTMESQTIPPQVQTALPQSTVNVPLQPGQSFTFNKGFRKILPPVSGPPFAPAGFGRSFPKIKVSPGGGVVPHASSGNSASGGGRHG